MTINLRLGRSAKLKVPGGTAASWGPITRLPLSKGMSKATAHDLRVDTGRAGSAQFRGLGSAGAACRPQGRRSSHVPALRVGTTPKVRPPAFSRSRKYTPSNPKWKISNPRLNQRPFSASSKARRTARALFWHSSCSRAGTESATMPAPACKYAVLSLMSTVRMTMQELRLPEKSR